MLSPENFSNNGDARYILHAKKTFMPLWSHHRPLVGESEVTKLSRNQRIKLMKNSIDRREKKMDGDREIASLETPTPVWVRVFAIIAITASLLFLGMMLADMVGMGNMSGMNGMSGIVSSPSRYLPLWIEVSGFIALFVVLLGFIALLAGLGGKTRRSAPSETAGKAGWFLSSAWRKLTLVTHITASVGWIGTVASFLVLAGVELSSQNALLVRGTFLSMNVIAWTMILPLSLLSLLTGLILGFFTKWGMLSHYWVLAKLLVNLLASIILLMYVQSLGTLTSIAATSTASGANLMSLRGSDSVIHSSVALVALLVAATLSVYKPRGMTRYGRRKQDEQRQRLVQERADREASAIFVN
jgi:hypothetical protein